MAKLTVHLVQDVDNADRPAMGRIIVDGRTWWPLLSPSADTIRGGAYCLALGGVARWGYASRDHLFQNLTQALGSAGFAITGTIEIDHLSPEDVREMSMTDLAELKELRKELAEGLDFA